MLQGYLVFGRRAVWADDLISEKILAAVRDTDGAEEHGLVTLREAPVVGISH